MLTIDRIATTVAGASEGLAHPLADPADIQATNNKVKQVSSASNESLSGLIAREIPKLRRLAWMLVRDNDHADDLVQDTIVRVLTYAHSWQPGTNFSAWVGAIMRNQFYTQCGSHARELMTLVRDEGHDASLAPAQDDRVACAELASAINRLPKAQREAVSLAAFEGLSSEEIATRMNISPNAARCHLMRGRKRLRAPVRADQSLQT